MSNQNTAPAPAQNQVFSQMLDVLNSLYVGREREALAVTAGLLSGEPTLLVGPPGTAKTALVESAAKLINARYYYYQLHEYSEPEELIGPVDIVALRKGEYKRIIDGYLPTAEIIFLDEIFRSSGAIRNMLLDIVLRKQVRIGSQIYKIPAIAIFAASNFISREDSDAAFVDRFVIRAFVHYVSEGALEKLIKTGLQMYSDGAVTPIASVKDVVTARQKIIAMANNIDNARLKKYVEVLTMLNQKGIIISDRRKIKIVVVAAAIAYIYGMSYITLDDLADALRFSVNSENELNIIEEVIREARLSESGDMERIETLITEVKNTINEIKQKGADNITKADIRRINELVDMLKKERDAIKPSPRMRTTIAKINDLIDEAIRIISA